MHADVWADREQQSARVRSGREHVFVMGEIGYTLTEHDPSKPWLILSSGHRTVELPSNHDFYEWAAAEWPAPPSPDRLLGGGQAPGTRE